MGEELYKYLFCRSGYLIEGGFEFILYADLDRYFNCPRIRSNLVPGSHATFKNMLQQGYNAV